MKIAVIGAGIFGCTAAIKLADAGHKVFLFERERSILSCASTVNQYRLHRGYHYPRSSETVQYVKESSMLFEQEFPSAICRDGFDRHYALATQGSLMAPDQYLTFLSDNGLKFEVIKGLPVLKRDKVNLIVKVQENGFDIQELYLLVATKLAKAGVNLRTGREFSRDLFGAYDVVVNATYANLNHILDNKQKVNYQYELCEKPIVQLGDSFRGLSVVVLDGEFCCVDPIGFNKDYQVLGHVREAIHDRQIGKEYKVPAGYEEVLNRRSITPLSRFDKMWKGFTEYFNADEVSYKGSMFTVRTVLPQHEHDDARPSEIIKHSDNLYSLFSGKIGTCVDIANKLTNMI